MVRTHYGQLTLYIPANWSLQLTFLNEEGIQHNAVLIQPNVTSPTADPIQDETVLAEIPHDAFAGGFIATGQSGSAVVRNLAPATYWVACAIAFPVPHAEEGMWVTLVVSNSVPTPYYTIAG